MQKQKNDEAQNSAESTLYERFAPTIFAYLFQQVASLQDAEDLLLEVFLVAFKSGTLVELPAERQLAWLRHVARNKVIDRYRHHSLLTLLPLEEASNTQSAELTPEQYAEQRETYAHLCRVLDQLTPVQQELIQLRYVHDLRFSEIAAILNKPEGTVRQWLVRTLQQLRKLYDQRERGKQT
jgi:RNA polymerase sigma-70 factor (ECF subfamily)